MVSANKSAFFECKRCGTFARSGQSCTLHWIFVNFQLLAFGGWRHTNPHKIFWNCLIFRQSPHQRNPCPWWHFISSIDDVSFLEKVELLIVYYANMKLFNSYFSSNLQVYNSIVQYGEVRDCVLQNNCGWNIKFTFALLISTVQDHQVLVFCQNFWVKDIQNIVLASPHTKVVMVVSTNRWPWNWYKQGQQGMLKKSVMPKASQIQTN